MKLQFFVFCLCVFAYEKCGQEQEFPDFHLFFFYIFIVFIKLSSSVGQAAGLGAVGLVLKNSIYHASDFVLCVICDGCGL
jgi:hypothetical protein